MDTIMQFLETTFQPLVLLFTVSNLAAMGLQVRMSEVAVALRNKKSLVLIFRMGLGSRTCVRLPDHLGPSSGGAICHRGAPRESGPCAPFLQQMVVKARGEMAFAGAVIRWWRLVRWC